MHQQTGDTCIFLQNAHLKLHTLRTIDIADRLQSSWNGPQLGGEGAVYIPTTAVGLYLPQILL